MMNKYARDALDFQASLKKCVLSGASFESFAAVSADPRFRSSRGSQGQGLLLLPQSRKGAWEAELCV